MAEVQPDIAIYKIVRPEEWAELARDGVYRGSAADRRDGFIHFSRADQVAGTLALHYGDQDAVVLLEVLTAPLIDFLRWEESRGGKLFPHLYGNFERDQVRRHFFLHREGDGWNLPELAGETGDESHDRAQ